MVWYCYIDSIFIVWEGPADSLNECIMAMNKNTFNLKFMMSSSSAKITFLDVTIRKEEDNRLTSTLYRKAAAVNMILHASSSHPEPLSRLIPYSQYLRIHYNCSDEGTFQIEAAKLRNRLLQRGCSATCFKKAYKQAIKQTRHNLLFGRKDTSNPEASKPNTLRIITKYTKQHDKANAETLASIAYRSVSKHLCNRNPIYYLP